jgi:hypothetical protein
VRDFVSSLRLVLANRFHDPPPEFDSPPPGIDGAFVARFRNTTGALGDVLVLHDSGGLIIEIEGWTHTHEEGTEAEMLDACVRLLELLFSDRVVVWGTTEWGGGLMSFADGLDRDQFEEEFGDSAASRVSTWSGRFRRINWG